MNHDLSGPIVREKLSPREFPKLNDNWGDFVSHFPNSYQTKAPLLKKFSIAPFLLAFQALGPFCSLCPKLIIQYSSNPLVCSLTYRTSGLVILLIPFPTLGKPSLHTSTVPTLTGFHIPSGKSGLWEHFPEPLPKDILPVPEDSMAKCMECVWHPNI